MTSGSPFFSYAFGTFQGEGRYTLVVARGGALNMWFSSLARWQVKCDGSFVPKLWTLWAPEVWQTTRVSQPPRPPPQWLVRCAHPGSWRLQLRTRIGRPISSRLSSTVEMTWFQGLAWEQPPRIANDPLPRVHLMEIPAPHGLHALGQKSERAWHTSWGVRIASPRSKQSSLTEKTTPFPSLICTAQRMMPPFPMCGRQIWVRAKAPMRLSPA